MFEALALVLMAVAGTAGPAAQAAVRPASPASERMAVLGVQLQYLDWGGRGEALLFLPPACETPHTYGDIAPAFTDRFRVLGLTTRGCGQSARADAYDLDTQIEEVAGFLDALAIDRAVWRIAWLRREKLRCPPTLADGTIRYGTPRVEAYGMAGESRPIDVSVAK